MKRAPIGLVILLAMLLAACRKDSAAPQLEWHEPVSGEALARAQQKRVVLFFGADWSKADVEIEHETFPHPLVRRQLADYVLIKVDLTPEDSPLADRMRARFKVVGDPTTIILRSMDGPELERFTEYVPAPKLAAALARR